MVLTTYETLRDYHFSFARTRFGLIIYDEIQKLKNPGSQVTRAASALNADFTLGMTGTPVENRLQDLWSIFDILAPGFLGSSREFERKYPIDNRDALGRLKAQLMDPIEGRPPYMLRRMKADALEGLPSKTVHILQSVMPPRQAQIYRDLVMRAAAASSAGTLGKGGMLSTLANMRGVSLHPDDPREALGNLGDYAGNSARLGQTLAVLDKVASANEKALIFVEDLAMQEHLAGMIQEHFQLRSRPMRINGGVPGPKRQALVDAFQGNPGSFDVMILSPRAGGVGLTLTAANHVIHLSRWWNPAVEDQATDRVYRIGQTRDVHVYLPLAVHPDGDLGPSSFDLRLNALIERKRQLSRDLFLPPEVNDGELSDLFREVSLEREVPADDAADQHLTEKAHSNSEPEFGSQEPMEAADDAGDAASKRQTLSLNKAIAEAKIRIWRCGSGEARPTAEILSMFAGRQIASIAIRDPYAISSRASREAQIQFLADLQRSAEALESIVIEYAPDADADLEEVACRREFGSSFATTFAGQAPRFNLVRRNKRSRDDDFHDRFVEIDVRHKGGAVKRHELSIGRGLEALYNDRRQCTVTYVPPSG